jgi:hypothetical protein
MRTATSLRYDLVRTDILNFLGRFPELYPETEPYKNSLRLYMEAAEPGKVKCTSMIPMPYSEGDNGRLYALADDYNGISLQGMEKSLRNCLVTEYVQDVDIINSAPTVLLHLYKKEGFPMPHLESLVDNYEEHMENLDRLDLNGKDVKVKTLFGGLIDDRAPPLYHRIRHEIWNAREVMWEKYPDILKIAREHDEKDREKHEKKRDSDGVAKEFYSNVGGKFVTNLYQSFEAKILQVLDKAGRDFGIWDDCVTFLFDGIMAHPSSPITQDQLVRLQDRIKTETGIEIKLKVKPISEQTVLDVYKIPPKIRITGNHLEAAEIAEFYMRKSYIRDAYAEFFHEDGIWINNPKRMKDHFLYVVQQLHIEKVSKDKKTNEDVVKPFSSLTGEAEKIIRSMKALLKVPTTNNFAGDTIMNSINKISFPDGYYEFTPYKIGKRYGHFVRGGRFDTFCKMPFDYPTDDEADKTWVMDNVFKPMFRNTDEGLMEIFLVALARAISGALDKVTYILTGPRNSGKSVVFQFLDGAFSGYTGMILPGTFSVGGKGGGDPYRQMSFMRECEAARIVKMNENPPDDGRGRTKIDGNMIKTFQSMKEGVMARGNHVDQRPYHSLATGFFSMNDVPEFTPSDSMDRCHIIELPNEFVTQSEIDKDRENPYKILKNGQLEELLRKPKYQKALFHILADMYHPDPITPLPCMDASKDIATSGTGDEKYLEVIRVTRNPQDELRFDEIKRALETARIPDGNFRIGQTLVRIIKDNFMLYDQPAPVDIKRIDRRRQSGTRGKMYYRYIRFVDPVEQERHNNCVATGQDRSNHGISNEEARAAAEAYEQQQARLPPDMPRASPGFETRRGSYATGENGQPFFPSQAIHREQELQRARNHDYAGAEVFARDFQSGGGRAR